jgi:hypothetical protein
MVFCRFARTKRDGSGRLEFYCTRLKWRMDMDSLEKCVTCSEYNRT